MRRYYLLIPAAVAALVLAGCASDDSSNRRTVTTTVDVPSGAAAEGSASAEGSAAAQGAAGDSAAPTDSSAPADGDTSAGTETSAAASNPVSVDPLKVDCGALMNAGNVKEIFGTDIVNDRLKITVGEVNSDAGQTGAVRCLYGVSADKRSGAISLRLTTYTDAAAAQTQNDLTVRNERDNNGTLTEATVDGVPATVIVRDGSTIYLVYDNWTMAMYAQPETVDPAKAAEGMPKLAQAVLARTLKT